MAFSGEYLFAVSPSTKVRGGAQTFGQRSVQHLPADKPDRAAAFCGYLLIAFTIQHPPRTKPAQTIERLGVSYEAQPAQKFLGTSG